MASRRPMLLSSLWVQATILTFLIGFAIMGFLALRVYQDHPPIPARVVSESGQTLFTGDDIISGQENFLAYGLMEYGTIYGHGAYLGPDFTAEYLHSEALLMRESYGGDDNAAARTLRELQANRYDASTGILIWTSGQEQAFEAIRQRYETEFLNRSVAGSGMRAHAITDPKQMRQIVNFIAWTAWTASARRFDAPYSYTNNWPPEPLVGNSLTRDAVVWSTLSFVVLLGGIGLTLALFSKYTNLLGWHSMEERRLRFHPPDEVPLTPAQRTTRWYFAVVSILFLMLALLGGATAHYHVEAGGFFGLDLSRWLPYNLTRTWHVQLSLFVVSTAYLAAGIFIAPLVTGREPRGQAMLSYVLLAALVVVVFGSLLGEAIGYRGWLDPGQRQFLGAQGWTYLDLGRLWQILLIGGLCFWVVILFRGLRTRLSGESRGNLPFLLFYSALSIPGFYAVGLLCNSQSNFAIADFWRFWVVHLWVEDFLELFTTIIVAYVFVLLGVVSEISATRVVYFDIILYSVGGVVGTMHHLYFSGTPAVHMAMGAFFSAGEVIPLTLLTVEAWTFLHLGAREEAGGGRHAFPHRWAVLYLASVGFWNFLGAGIFGFLVNLPVVSYYEIGTQLTANHAHAAMMGVYGMLAIALLVFCCRYLARPGEWSERLVGFSFWTLNFGLAWMIFANLLPLGILQLGDSVANGYWHARSVTFFQSHAFIEWLRLPGDVVFIIGVLPLVYMACRIAIRPNDRKSVVVDGSSVESPLFTEMLPSEEPVLSH